MKIFIYTIMIVTVITGIAFAQNTATMALPDTSASTGETIGIPIQVTTASTIGLAQFTIEYDSSIIHFDSAVVGEGVANFAVSLINPNLPFAAVTPGTSENVLVQLSGGGMGSFSGTNVEVVVIYFKVMASTGVSYLNFDVIASHTFLTTTDLKDITGSNITFTNGQVNVLYTDIYISGGNDIPTTNSLQQNYPNPFNPLTAISYQLSAFSRVDVSIFNTLGQKVAMLVSEKQPAGYYSVVWDAAGFSVGMYFCRMEAGEYVKVIKLALVK